MTESSRVDTAGFTPRAEAREPDGPDAPAMADGGAGTEGWMERVRTACRFLTQAVHLEHTGTIAFVVGLVLTAINQLEVIVAGDGTTATSVKSGLNFIVPFCVANLGLLSGLGEAEE